MRIFSLFVSLAVSSPAWAEVPGRFIYDPIAESSSASAAMVRLAEDREIPASDGSFTMELFVKPEAVPQVDVDLIRRGGPEKGTDYVAAGMRYLSNFQQTYWGAAVRRAGESKATRWSSGHYVSISRLREDTLGWRHLALVYDAESWTLTVWLDQWQARTERLEGPLDLGAFPFVIDAEFDGSIHSPRYTAAALGPEQFLRATSEPLEGVSYDRPFTALPSDAGYLNVVRHFGAVGDGKVDDTLAIQEAMRALESHQASGEGSYVLAFPAGTYRISDTVKWSRFLRVQGEGPDRTIIRLADRAPGFDDPENPKAAVAASAVPGPPGSNGAVNGSTIANWFLGFTVDTGKGNPGAVGVEFHSNNYGSFENNVIRSGDGSGAIGLDLSHKTAGPTLIANATIEGFDIGIKVRWMEYSMTMEDVGLTDQNEVGILNGGNILALHRITSRNRVPALRSTGGVGMVSVLNSRFTGGAPEAVAIESGGALFAKNVAIEGYGKSLSTRVSSWDPHRKPNWYDEPGVELAGDIEQFISDQPVHPEGGAASPLDLPVEDAPEVPMGDFETDWVNVRDFEHLVVGEGKDRDWAPALEAAIATGKPTLYFPRGTGYRVSRTVVVPPSVKRLYGMDNGIDKSGMEEPKDRRDPKYGEAMAILRIEGETDDSLLIDFFSVGKVEHVSRRPVRLEHARFTYLGSAGAGKVFLRDALGPWFSFGKGQQVWARQWNVESHADGPCVLADGATIWSLGFKTEYESQKLRASNGAAVEIFGSFIYPVVQGIPKDRPVFEIIDSRFSAQWGLSQYTASHFLQVRDVKDGQVRETTVKGGKQFGPRIRMDFYSNE